MFEGKDNRYMQLWRSEAPMRQIAKWISSVGSSVNMGEKMWVGGLAWGPSHWTTYFNSGKMLRSGKQ